MITNLIIPVINTENIDFKADREYSTEELTRMDEQFFIDRQFAVDEYSRNNYTKKSINDQVINYKSECLFLNSRKEEIEEQHFIDLVENGKMSLLLLNINPNSLENNAEEELRFWSDDSMRILNDELLDDRTRIKVLPTKTFGIEINNETYNLINCKLIENRSDKSFPFYYIIMIEKITK